MKLTWIYPIARGLLLADLRPRQRWWTRFISVVSLGLSGVSLAGVQNGTWSGFLLVFSLGLAWVGVGSGLARWLRLVFMGPTIGIAVGVSGIVAVSSVAEGMEEAMKNRLVPLRGHMMVTKYGLDFEEYEMVAERVLDDSRVVAASPFAWGPGVAIKVEATTSELRIRSDDDPNRSEQVGMMIKGLDPKWSVSMVGLESSFSARDIRSLTPAHLNRLPGIVLGKALARRLGVQVGDFLVVTGAQSFGQIESESAMTLESLRFQVKDTFHSGLEDTDNNLALVHLSAAQGLFFGRARVTGIEFQVANIRETSEIVRGIDQRLNAGRKNKLYRVHSWLDSANALDNIRDFRRVIQITLSSILLVSVLNLALMMAIVIRRKRRQIALMASLGAVPAQLFGILLVVGMIVAAIGIVIGLAMAAFVEYGINHSALSLALHESSSHELIASFSWSGATQATGLVLGLTFLLTGPVLWFRLQRVQAVDMWRT